jgi:hypothetical protein
MNPVVSAPSLQQSGCMYLPLKGKPQLIEISGSIMRQDNGLKDGRIQKSAVSKTCMTIT